MQPFLLDLAFSALTSASVIWMLNVYTILHKRALTLDHLEIPANEQCSYLLWDNILHGQMWFQCSGNCGHFKLKLKLLALKWYLICWKMSPLGHAVEAVIFKLKLSHCARVNWNCCLVWDEKLPFSSEFSGWFRSQLFEEHLEKAENKLLTGIMEQKVAFVPCWIPTEIIGLLVLDFVS